MALDISHLPREEQFKIFQQISARIGDIVFDDESRADDTPFVSNAWQLGEMLLTETSFPISTVIRSSHHIAMGNADYVRIRIFPWDHGTSTVDGKEFDIIPGDVHFVHGTSQVRLRARADRMLGLLIPYGMIDFEQSKNNAYFSATANSPTGRLIGSALRTTLAEMPRTEPGDVPLLASALIGMVRGLLMHMSPDEADQRSFNLLQRHALLHYVDANLMDPDLSVDKLSEVFHASRASIYRHFPDGEGLRAFVNNRRLDRCLQDLLQARAERGAVRRIAERWGFLDSSHFLKRFRDRFSVPPSEVLGLQSSSEAGDEVMFPDFAYNLGDQFDGRVLLANLTQRSEPND